MRFFKSSINIWIRNEVKTFLSENKSYLPDRFNKGYWFYLYWEDFFLNKLNEINLPLKFDENIF